MKVPWSASVFTLLLLTACASPSTGERAALQPITMSELAALEKSLLFGPDDVRFLRMSGPILEPQIEELLDVWYGFVGANPHLIESFKNKGTGRPDARYLAEVRKRFGAWVRETAAARFDEAWLAKQLEIGRRHHRIGKNRTDGVDSTDHIAFRHMVALQVPVTTTLRPFLERGGRSVAEVESMLAAWRKAVLLSVILWSQPYVLPGDF